MLTSFFGSITTWMFHTTYLLLLPSYLKFLGPFRSNFLSTYWCDVHLGGDSVAFLLHPTHLPVKHYKQTSTVLHCWTQQRCVSRFTRIKLLILRVAFGFLKLTNSIYMEELMATATTDTSLQNMVLLGRFDLFSQLLYSHGLLNATLNLWYLQWLDPFGDLSTFVDSCCCLVVFTKYPIPPLLSLTLSPLFLYAYPSPIHLLWYLVRWPILNSMRKLITITAYRFNFFLAFFLTYFKISQTSSN